MEAHQQLQQVQQLFEAWANAGRAEGMERGHGPAARRAFDILDLPPDGAYLDIGCGNGYSVRWAATKAPAGEALGMDLSPAMIARAREQSRDFPAARFQQSAFPDDSLPAAHFDRIFSMEVFYYLPDLGGALARVRQILKPGGLFACVVDYYEENAASHRWPEDLGLPLERLSEKGWRAAFLRAGLEMSRQERLKLAPGETKSPWKITHGSLLTLGRRPA